MRTKAEIESRLAKVHAAIERVLDDPNASVTIEGEVYSGHDLDKLQRQETELYRQLAVHEAASRPRTRALKYRRRP